MKRTVRNCLITCAVILLILLVLTVLEIRCFGCLPEGRQGCYAYYKGDSVHVCVNNFPDRAFRRFIRNSYCSGGHNVLSQQQLDAIAEMDCSGLGCKNLWGIELFTKLQKLDCSDNRIKLLETDSLSSLTELDCSSNQLSRLNLRENTRLQILNCEKNNLTNLSFSRQDLTWLDCSDNLLSYEYCFTPLQDSLTYLDCGGNCFRDLALYNMMRLTQLQLSPQSIEITTNPEMKATILGVDSHNRIDAYNNSGSIIDYKVRVVTKSGAENMEVRAMLKCLHQYENIGVFTAGNCVHCGEPSGLNKTWWVRIFVWAFPVSCVMVLCAVIYMTRRKARSKSWGELTNAQINDTDLQPLNRKR